MLSCLSCRQKAPSIKESHPVAKRDSITIIKNQAAQKLQAIQGAYRAQRAELAPKVQANEEAQRFQGAVEACKEIIMTFAAALGDSRPDLEKAISDALEKANEICLDTDTVGTNVSNPKDRIEQFKLNTPQGPYAQRFWIICSRLIAEKLSHFIRTQSNYSCPPSTVKISNQPVEDPESDEILNSNAELFIYLGFARFQLENLLNKIKKDPIANIFSTSSVSFYVDLSSRPIDQLAGVFSPQKELNCRQQQYLQYEYPSLELDLQGSKYAKIAELKFQDNLDFNPELFVCLGFARFQLGNVLLRLRANIKPSESFNDDLLKYCFASKTTQQSVAGVFNENMNLDTFRTEYLQENASEKGPFITAYEKLPSLQKELEKKYKSYPHQYALKIEEKEISIFSNSEINLEEFESTIKTCAETMFDKSSQKELNYSLGKDPDFNSASINIFIHIERNKDVYLICKRYRFYRKFYIPSKHKELIFTLGQISYSGKHPWYPDVLCQHMAPYFKMWPFIMEKFTIASNATKNQEPEIECLQKIGQFLFLYINIMPYRQGSAAIGEWLMRGFFHARGLNMGDLNPQVLSWDFNAFAYLSPEEYGEKFQDFFLKTK